MVHAGLRLFLAYSYELAEGRFLEITQGETIHLRYRVVIHANNPTREQLAAEFEQ